MRVRVGYCGRKWTTSPVVIVWRRPSAVSSSSSPLSVSPTAVPSRTRSPGSSTRTRVPIVAECARSSSSTAAGSSRRGASSRRRAASTRSRSSGPPASATDDDPAWLGIGETLIPIPTTTHGVVPSMNSASSPASFPGASPATTRSFGHFARTRSRHSESTAARAAAPTARTRAAASPCDDGRRKLSNSDSPARSSHVRSRRPFPAV